VNDIPEVPDIGEWLTLAPLRERAVSLFKFDEHGYRQAHDIEGKRLLASVESGDLFVLWTGRWRTDIRRVPLSQRKALHDALN
jgi:hypothetical protein